MAKQTGPLQDAHRAPGELEPDELARLVAQVAAALPFNELLGLEARTIRAGYSEVVLPATDVVRNHVGTVHAIAELAPAEMAAATAATSRLGDLVARGFVPVVRSLHVRYRTGAQGDVVAVAEVGEDQADSARTLLERGERPAVEVAVRMSSEGDDVGEVTVDVVFLEPAD